MSLSSSSQSITLYVLTLLAGCKGDDSPMDLSNQPPSDMSMSGSDAADPNAPGVVRYTYTCGTDPEKTIEMKRVLFGPTYWCSISKASFFLNVKDVLNSDRI